MASSERSSGRPDRARVLIVDDEEDVARSYEMWLREQYDVQCASDGETGLSMLDETVDVVLLDRMMPGMSGSEVLEAIRRREHDPKVAMVTAVDPDFDIIEMGFDDYVTKPPTREELHRTVRSLVERDTLTERRREYQSKVATRAALETEKTDDELAESEEYERLQREIEQLEATLDEEAETLLDDAAFASQLRDLTEGGDES